MMNELCTLLSSVRDGDSITLEKDKIFDVYPEDSYILHGFNCSNTACKEENPDGLRYSVIYLDHKKNVVIDGNGATVLVHGKMTPLLLNHCDNIVIKNLIIDYPYPTMTEFTVLDNQAGIITIRMNDDCMFRIDGNELYWHGETDRNGTYYWEDVAHDPYRYGKGRNADRTTFQVDCGIFTFTEIEQIDEHTLRCTLKNRDAYLPAGTIVQTRNIIRDQAGGLFQRCNDLLFEDLRIRFMHGIGLITQYCDTITFRNCDMTPKEGRTAACNADFFQFVGCRGKITIDGCSACGAQDDFINIHGVHLQIEEIDRDECTMLVRFCHSQTWGFQAVDAGDALEFIRWDTLMPYAGAKVQSAELLNDTDILLHVDSIPEGIVLGKDVIENVTWTPDVHICNSYFGPSCSRGLLCTTRGRVIVENNRYDTLVGVALNVDDDCNFWFESGRAREIIFRNNDVSCCDYGNRWETAPVIKYTPRVLKEDSTEHVHGKLVVTGNSFHKPPFGKHSFWLSYLEEAEITDNTFDAPYEIHTKICGKLTDQGNRIEFPKT